MLQGNKSSHFLSIELGSTSKASGLFHKIGQRRREHLERKSSILIKRYLTWYRYSLFDIFCPLVEILTERRNIYSTLSQLRSKWWARDCHPSWNVRFERSSVNDFLDHFLRRFQFFNARHTGSTKLSQVAISLSNLAEFFLAITHNCAKVLKMHSSFRDTADGLRSPEIAGKFLFVAVEVLSPNRRYLARTETSLTEPTDVEIQTKVLHDSRHGHYCKQLS